MLTADLPPGFGLQIAHPEGMKDVDGDLEAPPGAAPPHFPKKFQIRCKKVMPDYVLYRVRALSPVLGGPTLPPGGFEPTRSGHDNNGWTAGVGSSCRAGQDTPEASRRDGMIFLIAIFNYFITGKTFAEDRVIYFTDCVDGVPIIDPDPAIAYPDDTVYWWVSAGVEGTCGITANTVKTVTIDFPADGVGAKPGANGSPFADGGGATAFTFNYPGNGPIGGATVLDLPGSYVYSIYLKNAAGATVFAVDPTVEVNELVAIAIPTLSGWGSFFLLLLLIAAASWSIRRRVSLRH